MHTVDGRISNGYARDVQKPKEMSPSGSPILRHEPRASEWAMTVPDPRRMVGAFALLAMSCSTVASPASPQRIHLPPVRTDVDKSRPVQFLGEQTWNCPFPPEAAIDEIKSAVVSLRVTVRPDGTASDAEILNDPPRGFGRTARACALTRHYMPALDRNGTPVPSYSLLTVVFQPDVYGYDTLWR